MPEVPEAPDDELEAMVERIAELANKKRHMPFHAWREGVLAEIRHAQDVAARYAVEQMATKIENLTHYRMYDEDEPDDDSNYVFVLKLSEVEDANEAFIAALAEAQEETEKLSTGAEA